jgi:OmpA family protein
MFHRDVLKATGAGKVVTSGGAPAGGVRAALANFDIDGDALKVEHKTFLDGQVVPILRRPNSICILRGEASHTGSDAHNLELSKRRAQTVLGFLTSRGVPVQNVRVQFVGESLAGSFPGESADARAVSVLVARTTAVPAPQPEPAPAAVPKTATRFKIRMLGALSSGLGVVQIEKIFFQIWAPSLSVTTFYEYSSVGVGKGAGASISVTLEGPFNDFSTTSAIGTPDFGGAARFTTSGVGPFSVNFLNMMGLPSGVATIPNPLKLDTGFTVGLGLSTSLGNMLRGFTGPFSGP